MSDSAAPQPPADRFETADDGGDAPIPDRLPVLAAPPALAVPRAVSPERRTSAAVLPAVQAAAVAAGGFVAGAAVVGLVHRRQRRAPALGRGRGRELTRVGRARGKGGRAADLVVVSSRSLLVDVHLLGRPGADV